MAKTLRNLIGQPSVKAALNEVLTAKNYAERRHKAFVFPPMVFTGPTGSGKTYFAEAFAEALKEDGFSFQEVPINAGWKEYEKLADRVCAVNHNGRGTAIPSVIFVDEVHSRMPIAEQIKLIINIKEPRLFKRNDVNFFADPRNHAWILASNEQLDPALKRRCIEIPFTFYNRGEKRQLFTAMCNKGIAADALEYLESRSKPSAGEVENICRRLNLQSVDRISLPIAKTVIKNIGLFPSGLVRKDIEMMMRMFRNVPRAIPIETLRAVAEDVKTSATRNRLGTLMGLELVDVKRGGYTVSDEGTAYLKKLEKMQQEENKQKRTRKAR